MAKGKDSQKNVHIMLNPERYELDEQTQQSRSNTTPFTFAIKLKTPRISNYLRRTAPIRVLSFHFTLFPQSTVSADCGMRSPELPGTTVK